MPYENLVCPDCGHDRFSHSASAQVKLSGTVTSYGFDRDSEEIQDVDSDYDELTCEDCGAQHYDPSELVTEDVYNADGEGNYDSTDLSAESIQPWE